MTYLEQRLLSIIQDAFPLDERPYLRLAEILNTSFDEDSFKKSEPFVLEEDVFNAVENLRRMGFVRRIGGVYDSKRLGFISRLCAGKLPESTFDFSEKAHEPSPMEIFARAVNEEPAITHNYIRSHEYNVWFTVIAENQASIQAVVDRICKRTELHDVHVLSATKKYKINTVMGRRTDEKQKLSAPQSLGASLTNGENSENQSQICTLTELDRHRIRVACGDLPHTLTPFKSWGVSCDDLHNDLLQKRMRRFGAILRHQEAGYPCNAMVCFRINEIESKNACDGTISLVDKAGKWLAEKTYISHCYERPSFEGFSYNMYAMMHAQNSEELSRFVKETALSMGNPEYVVLNSIRELKKTSFVFFDSPLARQSFL